MRKSLSKNVLLEWHGDEVLAAIQSVTEEEERAAAARVFSTVMRLVPVGSYRRSYRPFYRDVRGRERRMKAWMQRLPGRLKSTVKKVKSKFEGGGYIVVAGSVLAYYARIVEFGTRMRRQKTTGRFTGKAKAAKFMRRAIRAEVNRFWADVRRNVRQKLGMK